MKFIRCLSLLYIFAATLTWAQITQFQHVIIVIQENRTPDNLFHEDSTLRTNGADIADVGSCNNGTVPSIPLTAQDLATCWDQGHSHKPAWENTWDYGLMDGACLTQVKWNVSNCNHFNYPQYTYVHNRLWDGTHGILDPYFDLANWYGYANYMFQTNMGPSFPAHQFLFSGTSAPISNPQNYFDWFAAENGTGSTSFNQAGCVALTDDVVREMPPNGYQGYYNGPYNPEFNGYIPPGQAAGYPCYEHPTLSDLLDNHHITWRYYAYYDNKYPAGANIWTAPNAISHICGTYQPGGTCQGSDWQPGGPIVTTGPQQVLLDIQSCTLADVSWVIRTGLGQTIQAILMPMPDPPGLRLFTTPWAEKHPVSRTTVVTGATPSSLWYGMTGAAGTTT